jgi:hypothetical protein
VKEVDVEDISKQGNWILQDHGELGNKKGLTQSTGSQEANLQTQSRCLAGKASLVGIYSLCCIDVEYIWFIINYSEV